jgi:hypothetical protein
MTRLFNRQEEDIQQILVGLEQRIAQAPVGKDRGSRSALSFLRELRRDRQDVLDRLRVRRHVPAYRQ